jgi:hypothetical protein
MPHTRFRPTERHRVLPRFPRPDQRGITGRRKDSVMPEPHPPEFRRQAGELAGPRTRPSVSWPRTPTWARCCHLGHDHDRHLTHIHCGMVSPRCCRYWIWRWQMSNGAVPCTQGISLDLTPKRAIEAMHLSTGQRAPRGDLRRPDGGQRHHKAIFEKKLFIVRTSCNS